MASSRMQQVIDIGRGPYLFVVAAVMVLPCASLSAQDDYVQPSPTNLFGFFLTGDLCYASAEVRDVSRLPPTYADSLPAFHSPPQAGFSMGMLWERRWTKLLSVRAMPGLFFKNGKLRYDYPDGRTGELLLERTELALSTQLIIGAKVPGGVRVYMSLGPMLACDLAADPIAQRVAFRWDLGGGAEFSVASFRMGIELVAFWQRRALPVEPGSVAPINLIEGLYWNTQTLRVVFKV